MFEEWKCLGVEVFEEWKIFQCGKCNAIIVWKIFIVVEYKLYNLKPATKVYRPKD